VVLEERQHEVHLRVDVLMLVPFESRSLRNAITSSRPYSSVYCLFARSVNAFRKFLFMHTLFAGRFAATRPSRYRSISSRMSLRPLLRRNRALALLRILAEALELTLRVHCH